MKKFAVLFSMVCMGFLLSSCLEDGNNNFSEAYISYIVRDNTTGLIYGRTLSGRFITSDKIETMMPGTFQHFAYTWDESYGTVAMGDVEVFKVVVSGDVTTIPRQSLIPGDAPEQEDPVYFTTIENPAYDADGVYFDDYWLFGYTYKAKEGETVTSSFIYYSEADTGTSNEVIIDLRLTKTGTPNAGATDKQFGDVVAVNMAALRAQHAGSSTTTTKTLQIKFRYYVEGQTGLYTSSNSYSMRVAGD